MNKKTLSMPALPSYDSLKEENFTLPIKKADSPPQRESPDSEITDKEIYLLEDLNEDLSRTIELNKSVLLEIQDKKNQTTALTTINTKLPIQSYAEAKEFLGLIEKHILCLTKTTKHTYAVKQKRQSSILSANFSEPITIHKSKQSKRVPMLDFSNIFELPIPDFEEESQYDSSINSSESRTSLSSLLDSSSDTDLSDEFDETQLLLDPKISLQIATLSLFKDDIECFFYNCIQPSMLDPDNITIPGVNHGKKFHEFSCQLFRIHNVLSLKTCVFFTPENLPTSAEIILSSIKKTLSEIESYEKANTLILFPQHHINKIKSITLDEIGETLMYSRSKFFPDHSKFIEITSQELGKIAADLDLISMSIIKIKLYPIINKFKSFLLLSSQNIIQLSQPWSLNIPAEIFPEELVVFDRLNELFYDFKNHFLELEKKSNKLIYLFKYFENY
jgi:hypothetical protein